MQQNTNQRKIRVTFDGLHGSEGYKYFNDLSSDIAKPGTFTDDLAWRQDLKVDDLIDCIDTEGTWYRSSVLETR